MATIFGDVQHSQNGTFTNLFFLFGVDDLMGLPLRETNSLLLKWINIAHLVC